MQLIECLLQSHKSQLRERNYYFNETLNDYAGETLKVSTYLLKRSEIEEFHIDLNSFKR